MRVLSVISAYPPSVGGAQLHAHELNRAMVRSGVDVQVATLWRETRSDWLRGTTFHAPPPRDPDALDGIRIHQLGLERLQRLRSALPAATYYAAGRLAAPALTRLYRDQARRTVEAVAPDVAHFSRVGREWWYAAFLDVLIAHDIPVVLTPNHHPHWGVRRRDWWWNDIYRRVDQLLVLSDHERDLLVGLGLVPDRVRRTVIGAVGAPIRPAELAPLGHPVVLFMGQVKAYKGLDVTYGAMVAHVWPSVPDARLVVIGPWVDSLRPLRRRLETDPRVSVLGSVAEATKWHWLEEAAVLCVPSDQEALGGVYLEAWTVGCPVVGADIAPVKELFHRTNGGVAVNRSKDDVGRTLLELLTDRDQRCTLGEAGRRAVLREYNWDVAATRTAETYDRAIAERRRHRPA